ncbi:lung seven transmembrane receptor domain-containing protein [Zalerion maritima]|uniref:Lung seven transmembrane receptor domain-containing protein n=1 Tax=Zalerion maritima TaxID=339359 RepID=A0AAD5WMM5_9PEZI|nr:lung seven transmembrane receptor domain-containing protein [Zalerion maritima]
MQDATDENKQRCEGMYSRNAWGGPVDPFIQIKFFKESIEGGDDPIASLVLFEWKDQDFIGVANDDGTQEFLCNPTSVKKGNCNDTEIGEFILADNAAEKSNNIILTKAIHLKDASKPITYPITKTGYYCILTEEYTAKDWTAVAEFRNAYGELPATQIPKLPFYGGITILYALVVVFWSFLYYQHRYDILAVQNYITAILIFLVIEMLLTWGFYDFLNRNGATIGSRVLLVIVGILNAVRNSFSFFLLLIVCMGYGVVKPSLGKTMTYVRWLAVAHFVFGLVYAIASLVVTPDAAGPFLLLIVMPLAGTLTAFYVWTLNSLNATIKDLLARKQSVKYTMYRKLWWCILASIIVIFAFFFLNSFSFASSSDPDYVPFHWKSRWFVLDGWLNLVYFADVAFIAYVWRPTANNRRFAMSDELAQDDDGGFEIGDIGVPLDSDEEDEEAAIGKDGKAGEPKYDPVPRTTIGGGSGSGSAAGPSAAARQPISSTAAPHSPSQDGETLFAVGEDGDKLSSSEDSSDDDSDDEDSSDDEDKKLVNKTK